MKGDHIMIWHGPDNEDGLLGFWHHGIDTGDGYVIHYSSQKPGDKTKFNGAVLKTARSVFASVEDESNVHVVEYDAIRDAPLFSPEEVVERAMQRVGHNKYDLVWDNCESFARWCKTGREISHQSRGAIVGGAAGVIALATGSSIFGGIFTALVVYKVWDKLNNTSKRRDRRELEYSSDENQ